ncbi:unnamed protein product [Phytomonas sp. EM1]|nr:unnamed protein product [Phytomonas sp. EM1]|eukprot:CCW59729.1 unnamed protein product [Phytomonas sp. isolate EM1]
MYISSIFALLIAFFIYENIVELIFPNPRHLSLTENYVNGNPPKSDKLKPFHYDTPMTLYEYFKIVLFTLSGVLVLRIAVVFLSIVLGMVCVTVMGKRNRVHHPLWFSFWMYPINFFGTIMLAALGFYNTRVYGKVAPRSQCKLLISNHSCVLEVVFLALLERLPSFVSRKENESSFFFLVVARICDAILIDRKSPTSRKEALDAICKRAKDPLGLQLMIFPEGSTANQLALLRFQKGAFESGNPVQMVCIYFPYKHFNPTWGGKMVGGNDVHEIVLRLCCQFVNYAEIRVLPVYYPTEAEKNDAILYANHCQKMMATVLNESVSDATFYDYDEAAKLYRQKIKSR